MLMMCWFYCIPFAKGLYFASSLLLLIFSLFVLKRGIRQSRPVLRQTAFLLIFLGILKTFTVDLYLLREMILCTSGWFASACNAHGQKILQASGLAALVVCSLILFNVYRNFIRNKKQKEISLAQSHLRFWANTSMCLVATLVLWLLAPWVGYLTVGHVPLLFMQVPWQHLAVLTIITLLIGFWKLEDCSWVYNTEEKTRNSHLVHVWTGKDTLWLAVILFLVALAFSYASNDVLSTTPSDGGGHLQLEGIDFSIFGQGFNRPEGH